MKRILFVCTGNTCRSPMAEVLAKDIINKEQLDCTAYSAGINVILNENANEKAVKAASGYGLDLSGHTARQAEAADYENSDIILTMTECHKNYILLENPSLKNKIFTLSEYATGIIIDVEDPYGRGMAVYESCLKQMKGYVTEVLKRINNTEE